MSAPASDPTPSPRRAAPPTAAIVVGSVLIVGGILAFAMTQKPPAATSPGGNMPVAMGNLPAPTGTTSPSPPGTSTTGNAPAAVLAPPKTGTPGPAPKAGGTVDGKFTPPKPAANPSDLPPDHPPITRDEGSQVGIQWHGYSCFYIHSPGGVVVVTDPFDPKVTGLPSPGIRGHLVTTSIHDSSHGFVKGVQPFLDETTLKPQALQVVGASALAQGDLRVLPIATSTGTAHLIEAGSLRIVHLGGVRAPLDAAQVKSLGRVDILMLPVGGGLAPKQAVALTKAINPAIVIPMEFATPDMEGAAAKLPEADAFISASPYAVTRKDSDVMLISRPELPASTEIFVLRYGH